MILQFSFLFCHARAKNSISSITGISLSKYICSVFDFNIILSLWIIFNVLRSSQMNKVNQVKSEKFINLTAFHRELPLINYQDLTQDTLFISLDLSI